MILTFGKIARHGGKRNNQMLVSIAFEEGQKFAVILDRIAGEGKEG